MLFRSQGVLGGFSAWIDNEYRRQGIGRLMLATSGVALEAKGFKDFQPGALTDSELAVYTSFNLEDPADLGFKGKPIEQLTRNPQTNIAIGKFV